MRHFFLLLAVDVKKSFVNFSGGRGRFSLNYMSRGIYKTSRGRGGLMGGSTILDKRPKRILISGFELDEKEELVRHFVVSFLRKIVIGSNILCSDSFQNATF